MLFGKKSTETKIKDLVWMSSEAKWKGLENIWKGDPNTVFVFWFDESLEEAKNKISELGMDQIQLAPAREINHYLIPVKPVVFAEHYPWQKNEQQLFRQLQLKEVKVLSALDEPLFKKFGGDKIVQLAKQMGMGENDIIQHPLISKAIQ